MIPARIKSPADLPLAFDRASGEVDFEAAAGQGRQDHDTPHFVFVAARRFEVAGLRSHDKSCPHGR
jgi:hypothetical protein